jgi:hypothetical protein
LEAVSEVSSHFLKALEGNKAHERSKFIRTSKVGSEDSTGELKVKMVFNS